ncbi:MAG: hypothetical protein JWM10_2899 [Myxococcaceae bacterium]|nr:hypothetical protein [Myxococcaceae bacterium]
MAAMRDRDVVTFKETAPVEYCTARGEVARGEVFLRPVDAAGRGERLLDVLSARAFVPVQRAGAGVVFLAPRHLAWVRIDLLAALDELDPEAEDDVTSAVARVVVGLAHGGTLEGTVRYALPEMTRRLGDYLERTAAFFPLHTDDFIYLVSVAQVASITPLAERR